MSGIDKLVVYQRTHKDKSRPTYKKSDLIARVAKEHGLSEPDAYWVVTTVFDSIGDALAEHQRIELRGFGSFSIRILRNKPIVDPRTGARIRTDAEVLKPRFKTSALLTARMNPHLEKP